MLNQIQIGFIAALSTPGQQSFNESEYTLDKIIAYNNPATAFRTFWQTSNVFC